MPSDQKIYVKFFPKDLVLQGMQYQLGLNIDSKEFNPEPVCGGGLHYTDFENINEFTSYGEMIGFLTIPDGVPIVSIGGTKYKSPQIDLREVMLFEDWIKNYSKHTEEKTRILDPILKLVCIENPSEDLQLAVVKQNGYAISYIQNPSEAVQLAAVNQNRYAIRYIKDPSEDLKLADVNRNGFAIRYIKDPSEKVKLTAVKQNGNAITFIQNPSEGVQLAAVKQNGYAIRYIQNPSEEVQLAAVKQNGYAISYIKNPSESVQLVAVNQNEDAIRYIKNPSEEV